MNLPEIVFDRHPCFSKDAQKKSGCIRLPVAPRCNIQCNFCNRKYDCINESQPGVAHHVLTPPQAVAHLEKAVILRPEISVVDIAGPGDPFATPDETMETLRLVRKRFPRMALGLNTNGFGLIPYVDEIADLRLSHVTLTINAVDPVIGGRIYAWVRDNQHSLQGEAAAALLETKQIEALIRLKARGLIVKINTLILPGINDDHIPDIAAKVAGLGVDIMNLLPLVPVRGSVFAGMPPPDMLTTTRLRLQCGRFLPQTTHCARGPTDTADLLFRPKKR
jgi:nitrogen fixation protein NifB